MLDEKYSIQIFYSEEDEGYIAIVPELSGCSAFGETREKALEEVKIAMKLWIKVAEEDKELLPYSKIKQLI
jgi:predicted RNase H-like HicB family nuclease